MFKDKNQHLSIAADKQKGKTYIQACRIQARKELLIERMRLLFLFSVVAIDNETISRLSKLLELTKSIFGAT